MKLPEIHISDFEIQKTDQKELYIGAALIGLSFLMPILFTVQSFRCRNICIWRWDIRKRPT